MIRPARRGASPRLGATARRQTQTEARSARGRYARRPPVWPAPAAPRPLFCASAPLPRAPLRPTGAPITALAHTPHPPRRHAAPPRSSPPSPPHTRVPRFTPPPPLPPRTMAEAIKAATVGVIDKIAAGTTAVADKVGLTTPASQTSLAPDPPAEPAEHVDPTAPEHLPPGGAPAPHPPPPPAGATSVSAGGKAVTPVGAGASVAQPVAAADVTAAAGGGAAVGGAPPAAAPPPPVPVEMVKEPTVPVVAVAAPVPPAAPVVVPAAAAAAAPMEASPAAGDGKRAVTFKWADAAPVVVKGSWDGWQGEVDCTGTGGVVRLAPGTYLYKYVVGGSTCATRWQTRKSTRRATRTT
ncbi:hypothetical protein BU14_0457s0005 [Porphyra umbilicalis]|uniref:AMP-activated protein kinase glycogen-binding domain-containing protein n=1 Tax=Porphyra umbilicalis TaxID=2786 RepID=A0A1X6NUE7_PORUM|nr:hypothetical protein BU14_0457s0005 [Porphyra umbilicalis]|eukprot:OSX72212.1 hypothetical protein BU14_0457s0005 [Porphyra umbilicalis]